MDFQIEITKAVSSRINEIDFNNLVFGKNYTDHMFVAEYIDGNWQNARVVPFGNLSLSPASSFMHYGQAIFEGMKAFKNPAGEPLLFRPEQNHKRWNISAERMGMPGIPYELFIRSLNELVWMDRDWIPTQEGCSLYLRPFMFAADEFIGIRPTEHFFYLVICSPAGKYYSKPVNVLASDEYVR
ncbi:MAG TPA: branched chain amino acid aminotransferase, partial [Bacteroidetes bacterium]|nr:branched chain amino acid aminotransferase [Bacteroidota bacterium]